MGLIASAESSPSPHKIYILFEPRSDLERDGSNITFGFPAAIQFSSFAPLQLDLNYYP